MFSHNKCVSFLWEHVDALNGTVVFEHLSQWGLRDTGCHVSHVNCRVRFGSLAGNSSDVLRFDCFIHCLITGGASVGRLPGGPVDPDGPTSHCSSIQRVFSGFSFLQIKATIKKLYSKLKFQNSTFLFTKDTKPYPFDLFVRASLITFASLKRSLWKHILKSNQNRID